METRETWSLDALARYDEIIDVRSPAEYRHDHIPGARNLPVLDDAQRARIGTLHRQASAFEARKAGAPLIAAAIAAHLERHLHVRGRDWRPLVYCWRGGARSAALTHVLNRVGWRAEQLPGGYKTYRAAVLRDLAWRAPRLCYRVLCGKTGAGKSRLLRALAARGAQTVDLEALANHRGSVLGEEPAGEQPSQKRFDSLLCAALRRLAPGAPVYCEAESRRIGRLQLPDALLRAMRAGECVRVAAELPARAAFLARDYRHFLDDPARFKAALAKLAPHAGARRIAAWLAHYDRNEIDALVRDLLEAHYDPLYLRSIRRHFARYDEARVCDMGRLEENDIARAAARLSDADARPEQAAAPARRPAPREAGAPL